MDKKNVFKVVLIALLLVSTKFIVHAQSLSLSVSANTIGKEDVLEATYTFSGINAPRGISPDFKDWNVANNRVSYETDLINEKSSFSCSYIFDLTPKRTGKLVVSGISVNVGGKQLSCSSVSVNVSAKAHLNENNDAANNQQSAIAAMQQQMQQQMAAMMRDMNNFSQPNVSVVKRNGERLEQAVKDKIFIRVIPSKTTCYLGEPVSADYEVYIAVPLLSNPQTVRLPAFDGFSVTDVNQAQGTHVEQLNGKNYEVGAFRKSQLVPLKTGDLQLDAAEMNFQFNYKDASNAGNIRVGTVLIKSEPMTIHVLPLPTKNKPADFSGAIGNFSITANVDKNVLPAQETNHLYIRINGVGTLNNAALPQIVFPSVIQSYDAKDSQTIDKSQLPMPVTLSFDVPFLGNKKGNAVIPPIKFSYFNTQKGDYETLATDSIKLSFSEPAMSNHFAAANTNALKYGWIAAFSVIILLLLFWFLGRKKQKRERKNSLQVIPEKENATKSTTANAANTPIVEDNEKMIDLEKKEKLKEALLDLELESNNRQFFILAKALLIQYLQDELSSDSNDEQELLQQLQAKNATQSNEVSDIFACCNKALYMPAVSATGQTEILKKLKLLIN